MVRTRLDNGCSHTPTAVIPALLCLALLAGVATQAAAQTTEASFASGSQHTDEGAGTRDVTINLSPAPMSEITLNYIARSPSYRGATPGVDYAPLSGKLTVPAGATTATIPVMIFDDSKRESYERFWLRLVAGAGYRVVGQSSHLVHIASSDEISYELSIASLTSRTREGAGTHELTVKLSPAQPDAQTLEWEAFFGRDRKAAWGADFTIAGVTYREGGIADGTFTVPAWATTATVPITIIDDSAQEASESVLMKFWVRVPTGNGRWYRYSKSYYWEHELTILDDDGTSSATTPVASFAMRTQHTHEGAGTRNVAVNLWPAPTSGITLSYTVGGTATSGSDFTALSGTLPVPAGAVKADIPVTILADSKPEIDETVVLTLASGTGYTLSAPGVHTLTVVESDSPPAASFATGAQSATEKSGTRNVVVNLSEAQTSPFTLNYTVGGTATSGSDFTIANSGTVSVPTGATTATIPVAITDDSVQEDSETVVLKLAQGENYRVGSPDTHTMTIGSMPVVSFDWPARSADEGSGTFNAALSLSPAPTSDIELSYTVGGTATPGSDYTALSGTVSVPTGARTATIPVAIIDDIVEDSRETVILTLTDRTGYRVGRVQGAGRLPSARLTLFIMNHDPNDLQGLIQARIDEAVKSGDAAAANLWRRALAAVRGEVPANGLASMTEAEARRLANSHLDGGDTDVGVLWLGVAEVIADGPATLAQPSLPEVAIVGGADAAEGEAAVFTLSASPAPSEPLAVDVTVTETGGYATAGTRQVTIPVEGTARLRIATTGGDTGGAGGTVTATLATGTGYTVSGAQGAASVAVLAGDAAGLTVSLSAEHSSIAEADGETKFTIALSRALEAGETATVPFTVTGAKPYKHWNIGFRSGDSGPGVARTATGRHSAVTFTQGGQTAVLVLSALANDDDRDRTVRIAFGTDARAPSATGIAGGVTPAGKALAVTIVDDDAPVTVSLAAKRTSIAEAGGETRFTIALSRALEAGETATVPFTVTGAKPYKHWNIGFRSGDSGPGVARTATGRHSAVTFTQGGQTAVLVLSAVANDDDRDRTVRIAFGTDARAPSATGIAGGIAPAGDAIAVAIVDDDSPGEPEGRQDPEPVPVLALAGAGAVTEGAGADFTLTAAPPPASDLAVTLRITRSGDTVAPSDTGERTVTLAGGTATKTVTVATVDDAADEPDGALTATVVAVGDAPVESGASATVEVTDDDATAVTLSAPAGDIAEADGRKTLTVTLGRALVAGETLTVPLTLGGTATPGSDYTLAAPDATPQGVRYAHLASADPASPPALTFTGPSVTSATLLLTANADASDEGAGERATVALGALTATGLGGGARGAGGASFAIVEPAPEVSIAAQAASVTEGAEAVFTVRASRAPDTDLTVKLAVSEGAGGDHVAADDEGDATVTIAKGETEAAFSVATVNDAADEPDGAVTVTVAADGEGDARYRVAPAPHDAASVAVADDDAPAPALSVGDATVTEGAGLMWFTIRLGAPLKHTVSVSYRTRESTPVSAQQGRDYLAASWNLDFRAGETEKRVWVLVYDDSHDEEAETFEFVLWSAHGAPIADGVGVGTIVNDDPMPAAWLARFGRTVAEQALDGIAGRIAAPRHTGMQGTLAGQALAFEPTAGGGNAAPGTSTFDGTGALAVAEVARGFGGQADRGIDTGPGGADRFGEAQAPSQTMTAHDVLLGSHFSLTGKQDAGGGSLALWGRAAQGRFDGREGTFSLDGEATTAMLGADYARGRWLVGLALAQSEAEGGYADSGTGPRRCPDGMDEATRRALCDGAVREGDGMVEASLTAAIPYASLQASERIELWGALGHGTGEVTLKPEMGGSYKTDTTWRMAAAGLRGDLTPPPAEGSGPALALTSDALWARTSSERTRGLAASESDATRLRLGLEGSYRFAMEGAGHLTPTLAVGARHDGGDAETGSGIELGGGLVWSDPALGLQLDLSGRTLLAHESDELKDRGIAASLAFDPDPASERGLSLALRQELGARSDGGLDALFAPAPLDERTGGETTSRWTAQAAYGLPVFGGRFTAGPHAGLGLATGARDYTLGWRLSPAANGNAPDLSFGLEATRRESAGAAPEHTVGFEVRARW